MTNVQQKWRSAWRDARITLFLSGGASVDNQKPIDDDAMKCLVLRQTRRLDLRDRLHFFKSKKWVSNFLN